MLYYFLQVFILQFIFLLFYRWFLQKETFFQWNRLYLISVSFLSFIIPLVRLSDFYQNKTWTEHLQPVIVGSNKLETTLRQQVEIHYNNQLIWIYLAGFILFLILFAGQLYQIYTLVKKHKTIEKSGYTIVLLTGKKEVFSFWRYVFIDEEMFRNNDVQMLSHEWVHLKEKHWIDLLYFEVLKVIFWFNPLLWIYQKEIKLLHEFIADKIVLRNRSFKEYFNQVLQETFQVRRLSFVNQFYQPHFLKKRIMMQKRKKSSRLSLLKYGAFILVLIASSFLLDACKQDEYAENVITAEEFKNLKSNEIIKIVVTKNPDKIRIYNKNGDEFVYYPKDKAELYDAVYQPEDAGIDTRKESNEVAFQFLKNPPVYEGCEGLQDKEAKDCFSDKIRKFVVKNFNTSIADSLGLKGQRVKILTMFTIGKDTKVKNIRARSKYKALEKEAKRVISMLPPVKTPGIQDGKSVDVTYTLPIIFKVEE